MFRIQCVLSSSELGGEEQRNRIGTTGYVLLLWGEHWIVRCLNVGVRQGHQAFKIWSKQVEFFPSLYRALSGRQGATTYNTSWSKLVLFSLVNFCCSCLIMNFCWWWASAMEFRVCTLVSELWHLWWLGFGYGKWWVKDDVISEYSQYRYRSIQTQIQTTQTESNKNTTFHTPK
jgi:hypothetical protein